MSAGVSASCLNVNGITMGKTFKEAYPGSKIEQSMPKKTSKKRSKKKLEPYKRTQS